MRHPCASRTRAVREVHANRRATLPARTTTKMISSTEADTVSGRSSRTGTSRTIRPCCPSSASTDRPQDLRRAVLPTADHRARHRSDRCRGHGSGGVGRLAVRGRAADEPAGGVHRGEASAGAEGPVRPSRSASAVMRVPARSPRRGVRRAPVLVAAEPVRDRPWNRLPRISRVRRTRGPPGRQWCPYVPLCAPSVRHAVVT